MEANSIYVFQTNFYTPKYKEFYRLNDLKDFLRKFSFMRSHDNLDISAGLPEFRLGYRVGVVINGYYYKSDIHWGPRFICAKSIRKNDEGDVIALVPVDKVSYGMSNKVRRTYEEMKIVRKKVDAIIDMKSLRQIWPKRSNNSNELERFIKQVCKNTVKTRKVKER